MSFWIGAGGIIIYYIFVGLISRFLNRFLNDPDGVASITDSLLFAFFVIFSTLALLMLLAKSLYLTPDMYYGIFGAAFITIIFSSMNHALIMILIDKLGAKSVKSFLFFSLIIIILIGIGVFLFNVSNNILSA